MADQPMILRIDHVAVAVSDREKAEAFFVKVLGAVPGASGEDPVKKFRWATHSLGDLTRLELLTRAGEGSFLEKFLEGREGGVHHMTLQTGSIRDAMRKLDEAGVPCFGYHEYPGGVWKEIFIHPRDACGVLVQIAEFDPDDWLPASVKMPGSTRSIVERTKDGVALTLAHPGGGRVTVSLKAAEAGRLAEELRKALEETGSVV